MSITVTSNHALVCVQCYKCQVDIWMTNTTNERLRNSHEFFYCINGHCQAFTGRSALERERDEAKATAAHERQRREWAERDSTRALQERLAAERSRAAMKGQVTRLKNRVAKGVCPCCNRHFANLEKHMANQHPEFTEPAP